ncbi:MAG: hypothetical protein JO110_30120 [Acetobacteraceae bacterium]|nr:hypothetical protein [Acetobacteraceae bacterium]
MLPSNPSDAFDSDTSSSLTGIETARRPRLWSFVLCFFIAGITLADLVSTKACAFAAADLISDIHIAAYLLDAEAQQGANLNIVGFAFEHLVKDIAMKSLGRECQLAPKGDRLADVICPGSSATDNPMQIQVKSGISLGTATRICKDLEEHRYNRARIVLADDTFANVLLKCTDLVREYERAGMLERAGIPTSRVYSVAEAMRREGLLRSPKLSEPIRPALGEPLPNEPSLKGPLLPRIETLMQDESAAVSAPGIAGAIAVGRPRVFRLLPTRAIAAATQRPLPWLPILGTIVAGILYEEWSIVTDPSLDTHEKAERTGGLLGDLLEAAAVTGAAAGGAAIAAAMLPSAPAAVSIAGAVTAAIGAEYALTKWGIADALSTKAGIATRWLVDQLTHK